MRRATIASDGRLVAPPMQRTIAEVTASSAFLKDYAPCPVCGDVRRGERLVRQWEGMPIPQYLSGYDFASYRQHPHVTPEMCAVADAIERRAVVLGHALAGHRLGHEVNLMLLGDFGTGKTGLAYSALRTILALARTGGAWLEMSLFLSQCRKAMGDPESGGADALIQRYAAAPVLLLDDVGKEQPTPWALSVLWNIVQTRHSDCLPTIVTSNLSLNELRKRLAAVDPVQAGALVERLTERAGPTGMFFFVGEGFTSLRLSACEARK